MPQHEQKIRNINRVDCNRIVVAYENRKAVLWNICSPENPIKEDVWEGMGASIDHLVIGKHVGVTASNQVRLLNPNSIPGPFELK